MQNPVKFDLFRVTYSDVGFRNHRDCFYRVKVMYPNGKSNYLYYATYSEMVRFFNLLKRFMQ